MKNCSLLFRALFICLMVLYGCQPSKVKSEWKELFNGDNLEGWTVLGGNATYVATDGKIIGTSVMHTPNSFLRTDAMFEDFILELEFKVDSLLNSGIQIRSNSLPSYRDGVVHGYQVEIDPSKRAWSGGIYEEQGRGWLNNLKNNHQAQKAFRQNQWNHYRIEAIGDTIKTWINGVPAAHLIDSKTSKGFIALQVHDIGNDSIKEGTQVAWRNIRILTEYVDEHSSVTSIAPISIQ